jgi:hypothetical protein
VQVDPSTYVLTAGRLVGSWSMLSVSAGFNANARWHAGTGITKEGVIRFCTNDKSHVFRI